MESGKCWEKLGERDILRAHCNVPPWRWVFFLVLLALFLVPQAHATAIGVNRASVQFQDVLRDGFAREVVVVTTDSIQPIEAEVIVEGEAAPWLNFSAERFNFSRDNPYRLSVDVLPPQDAQIREYKVNMSIITGELSRTDGGRIGTATRASLGIPITLRMTGSEIVDCSVAGLVIRDSETGEPIIVQLTLRNEGNVRLNPDLEVEVYDKFRTRSLGTRAVSFGTTISPTLLQEGVRELRFDLSPDQYWATVTVPACGYSGIATFDVLDPGGIKDEGEFVRLIAPQRLETGEIGRIAAVFRNSGARPVRAHFKGTIRSAETEEIVKVIDTDQYVIDPGLSSEIETFFNPQQPGRYVVNGKVLYNSKLTGEKKAIINVGGMSTGGLSTLRVMAYAIILGIILLLLLIIRKKRGRHRYRRG